MSIGNVGIAALTALTFLACVIPEPIGQGMIVYVEGTVTRSRAPIAGAPVRMLVDDTDACPTTLPLTITGTLDTTDTTGVFAGLVTVFADGPVEACVRVDVGEPADTTFFTPRLQFVDEEAVPDTFRVEVDLPE